jgi:hypothetical protein
MNRLNSGCPTLGRCPTFCAGKRWAAKSWGALAALILVFAACASAQQPPPPSCGLVPGWQQAGPLRSYEGDTLYEYMDGNSEGYLLYRFVAMKGVTCKSGGDTFVFDISEMADADFAWGMFMSARDMRQPIEAIGMAGQVLPRKATFAKGKYYVEIAADPEKDHRPALRAFVVAYEKLVPGRTTAPAALAWFPKEGLVADSVRLVPESVLGIGLLKSGFIARYDFGQAFVVPAESGEAAAQLMEKWKARIGQTAPAKMADEAFTATDKYLSGLFVFRKGRLVAGFANLQPGRDVSAEATRFSANLKP